MAYICWIFVCPNAEDSYSWCLLQSPNSNASDAQWHYNWPLILSRNLINVKIRIFPRGNENKVENLFAAPQPTLMQLKRENNLLMCVTRFLHCNDEKAIASDVYLHSSRLSVVNRTLLLIKTFFSHTKFCLLSNQPWNGPQKNWHTFIESVNEEVTDSRQTYFHDLCLLSQLRTSSW